jgi:hypothetical protein
MHLRSTVHVARILKAYKRSSLKSESLPNTKSPEVIFRAFSLFEQIS